MVFLEFGTIRASGVAVNGVVGPDESDLGSLVLGVSAPSLVIVRKQR